MENEKAELMVTIQKGEGFDTAIQQVNNRFIRIKSVSSATALFVYVFVALN